jgi:hypothetical protein
MKKISEMTDEEKAELAKQLYNALLPIFQIFETFWLDMVCWFEKAMAAAANATAPPLDWLFEN